MSADRQIRSNFREAEPEESGEYVRVPAVVDAKGNKVVTLTDDEGREQTRLVAELVLESFVGACPSGYILHFKDGNRLNCELKNLEWAPTLSVRDEGARDRAIATRERADAVRRSLQGRRHSDSAQLMDEDRQR